MYNPDPRNPLRDYLESSRKPGVSQGYVVLPRSLAEGMPLPWQQQMAHLLRVVPSRRERLVDLDEEQLAEVGCFVEIDVDGELVYRERNGKRIEDPENQTVLVSCLDPIPGQHQNANQDTPPRGIPMQHAPGWS
jgi:hypothetical protein